MKKTSQELLSDLRAKRNFKLDRYIVEKVRLINNFFREEKLDSVVLGLSGGVDSSVALYLYLLASAQRNSHIRKVMGISMPVYSTGSTNQATALHQAQILAQQAEIEYPIFEYVECDLSAVCMGYHISEDTATDFDIGQLLSIVRTPYLYFRAAMLQSNGYSSIVGGTTNRSEGGIIGFYGKASDAMNDLQVLADLHKSEVYELARYFDIPSVITDDAPRGDVYNGLTDEELIGTSYNMVELYMLCLDYGIDIRAYDFKDSEVIKTALESLDKIINKNAHKYKVGLPCRFLDTMLYPRKVHGGWK